MTYFCGKILKTESMNLKLIIGSVVLLWAMAVSAQEVAPDTTGMSISAQSLTSSIRMGWNLGNALESEDGETGWGNPATTLEMLTSVRDAGFDAVCIPVRWTEHLTDATAMTIDVAWMNRVQEVVDWCLSLGFRVIINTHHEKWLEQSPLYSTQAENNRKLAVLWTQIATHFRNYDSRLIFAGINETQINWQAPTAENTAVVNSYNQTFVNAVRATGGRNYYRNLVVQTYSCNPDYGFYGFVAPIDQVNNRISVEFHYYNPYNYCSGDTGSYNYWGTAYAQYGKVPTDGEAKLKATFARAKGLWTDKGYGVVIGEYGVSYHTSGSDVTTQEACMQYYLRTVLSEAHACGFAAFVWDNSSFGNGKECFGIFNRQYHMFINTPCFLTGLRQTTGLADDNTTAIPLWIGNETLNWGSGLQLNVVASKLIPLTVNGSLQLTYTTDSGADYSMLQLLTGSWTKLSSMTVDGTDCPGEFTALGAGTHTAYITFPATVLAQLHTGGLNIQGHGVHLRSVVMVPAITASISSVEYVQDHSAARTYGLNGIRVAQPRHLQLAIRGGRTLFF
jgi:endoglucanase